MEIKTPIIEVKMTGGTRGIQGEKGIPGKDGENGATFTPSISTDGILSWNNDKGLTNPSEVNIKGPQGNQGVPGVGIESITTGMTTQNEGYTVTPLVFQKSDKSTSEINVWVKNGIDGANGESGETGATFTPSVSESGDLSWTNDRDLDNPSTINIKGDSGLPYLIYIEPIGSTGEPAKGQYFVCSLNKFNRMPQVDDVFLINWLSATKKFPAYLTIAKITEVREPNAACRVLYSFKIGGENGTDGISITSVTAGTSTESDGYTMTPVTFEKSDGSNVTVNISAKNGLDGTGSGDMSKSVYDTNNDGIVDNAETVNGHTVEKNVPENAQFTDTTNYEQFTNKPQINNVELSGNKTLDELGIQAKGNYALQEVVDAIEGQVQETENTMDNLSDSINNLSNTTNELNDKIDKIVLKSLSDIGLSEFTTLDAIVTAVPNGKTLRLYLSDDNASTLYGTSGGTGNLPTNIAGILTVQKNSENNWVYITYKTNLSVFENANAGIFYTTKFTGYRDWTRVVNNMQVTELYVGSVNSTKTVTLNDNYNNYDMIVAFVRADYNNYKLITWYKGYYGYKQNCTVVQSNGYASYGYIGLNSNNKCTITSAGSIGLANLILDRIIGINFNKVSGDE